jgi:hypothetical protein
MQATAVIGAVFAAICLGVALTGFSSLGDIDDPAQLADAKGFASFWAFLGGVAIFFGAMAWWMARNQKKDE